MRLTNAPEPAKTSDDAAARIAPARDPETMQLKRVAREHETSEARPSARPSHWRPDIEGLRAVAVGVVIAAHIGFPYMAGGFVGVDVFFVISGFLITSLLLREIDKTGTVSIAGFYARRAVRLLPAAATVLLATLVAAWLWLPRTRLGEIAADAATAALNVINIRLAREGTDYLNADAAPSPLQHFWSLAVEEQFYIAWPLILLAIAVIGAKLSKPGKFTSARHRNRGPGRTVAIAALLLITTGVSFWMSATWTADDPVWSYFGIHTRAWELAIGALIAVAAARLRAVPGWVAAIASWAGLALIVAAVFLLDERTVFPGTAAMLPVAGAALVIAAGCIPHRFGATLLLGIKPAQFIGKISYGLYLWHWPVIMIGPAVMGLEDVRVRHYLFLMVVAFLLTVATFYLIENPIRTRRPLVQVPSRALAMGGGLVATALAASLFMAAQPMPVRSDEEAEEITGDGTTVWEELADASDVDTVPANLTPSLEDARLDTPSVYDEQGCVTDRDDPVLKKDCWFGDPDGEKTIVLFGDSHAAQWFPALNQNAEAAGWRLLAIVKSACTVAQIDEYDAKLGREYTECADWKQDAFDYIDEVEPDAVVAVSWDDKEVLADDPDKAWEEGWVETVDRLQGASEEVYYMADNPQIGVDVPSCLAEHPENATVCVGQLDESVIEPERREATMEAVADAGATVVDPIPWMCDFERGTCPVVVGNLLMYRDSNHLAPRFVAELAPQVAAAIPLEAQPTSAQ